MSVLNQMHERLQFSGMSAEPGYRESCDDSIKQLLQFLQDMEDYPIDGLTIEQRQSSIAGKVAEALRDRVELHGGLIIRQDKFASVSEMMDFRERYNKAVPHDFRKYA